ncbi:hypothetical protein FD755_007794 [Muntiacus reevesi]|uniref:MATH domain-containing protein n=1 Tax=Muntiacus reevesi TaxID=9886 RepID=A0A5J5MIR4_MUNRE|nr:hypothetical protein FD755_007794 [Muntiacus reevesi]
MKEEKKNFIFLFYIPEDRVRFILNCLADSLPSEPIGKPSIYHRPLKLKESIKYKNALLYLICNNNKKETLKAISYFCQYKTNSNLCFFQPGVCHDSCIVFLEECVCYDQCILFAKPCYNAISYLCWCPGSIDKRGNLQEHERSALWDHMLLVLEKNFQLEEQISDLYKSLEQKEIKIQQLAETVKKFKKEFKQFAQLFGKNGSFLSNMQVLASHIDKSAWLKVQQQSKFDLRPLVEAIDTVKQKITLLETNDQRLLNKNEERFRLLESACYNGKLIWKVTDYKLKKKEALDGHTPMWLLPCTRAYLNGDGSGKGAHLSLYFVVMRGEFDSLLQWPFRQRVTLMLLDQSGKKNHIMETFKADPNSSSFKRPDGEMNIATGCPRFVAHSTLENAKNTYIKDDTLFLKMAVDLSDLEDL